jgi:hypothetical protein
VREFQQKLQEDRDNTAKGVNIPQINKAEMKKIKVGLTDLFKMDLILMLKDFQPCPGNFQEWLAFEGAYEECLDRLRKHILKSLDRDTRTLYGTRKINGRVLAAMARRKEDAFTEQQIHGKLKKLKERLEQFTAFQEDSTPGARKMQKLRERIHELFRMMTPATRIQKFGEESEDAIWETLNGSEEHRNNVIEWLEAEILTNTANELKGMAERLHAKKVQEAYRTSPSIAMKRYIDRKVSPPCPTEKLLA